MNEGACFCREVGVMDKDCVSMFISQLYSGIY